MQCVANLPAHPALDVKKHAVTAALRERYAGYDRAALKALPVLRAYADHYRRFRKTYHIQLQLESIILKGKEIPQVATLVEAMFVAELEDLLLTAGHDLAKVQQPLRLDVAQGSEQFEPLRGEERVLKAGDMFITDTQGILSTVLEGSDHRTQITPGTQQVLFTTYAPAGIGAPMVADHLTGIEANVRLFAPDAETLALATFAVD